MAASQSTDAAFDELQLCVLEADALTRAINVAFTDANANPPHWLWVWERQVERIKAACEAVEVARWKESQAAEALEGLVPVPTTDTRSH